MLGIQPGQHCRGLRARRPARPGCDCSGAAPGAQASMSGRAWLALVIVVGLVTGSVLFIWLTGWSNAGGVEEIRLPNRTPMPVSLAAAPGGAGGFTPEASDVI